MLDIPSTKFKLAEARFFLGKLSESADRVVVSDGAFHFYLSAFLSAARSVTFVLQSEQKAPYDSWFPDWRDSLSQEDRDLLNGFNRRRRDSIHLKGPDVSQRVERISAVQYLVAASREGHEIEISGPIGVPPPDFQRVAYVFSSGEIDTEVVKESKRYLDIVARLVEDFVLHYNGSTAA